MTEKYKITIEHITDEGTEVLLVEEYAVNEVNINQERFITPRYDGGNCSPVGFWDEGHKLVITATHRKLPEPI